MMLGVAVGVSVWSVVREIVADLSAGLPKACLLHLALLSFFGLTRSNNAVSRDDGRVDNAVRCVLETAVAAYHALA